MFERLQAMFRSRLSSVGNRSSGFNQPLPQHGILYFDLLDAKLRSKSPQAIEPELELVVEEIHKRRQEKTLTWNDLYTFDLILARSLRPAQLAREVWSLRSRYRDVVGLHEYEAYLASKPPDLAGQQVQDDALLADIEYLLGQIYLRYAITPINQVVSDRISRRVTLVILCGVALTVIAVMQKNLGIEQSAPATLLTVLFVGAMGGLLSMQQRYQSVPREGDPIDNISELMQNWSRLFLPAISGGIFAVLLYMLFIGQLIQGDLFPKIIPSLGENKTEGTAFWDLLSSSRPFSGRDYAKLIIWSFIAGFAERYVPDTLSHFISRRETEIRTRVPT